MEKIDNFKEYLAKISRYEQALSLIYWDLETYAPDKSVYYRSKALAELSEMRYNLFVSNKMAEFLAYFAQENILRDLNETDKALIKVADKEFEKIKKIPAKLVRNLAETTANANLAWKQAKENDDFSIFQPYLDEIIRLVKEEADSLGYEKNRYDALLDLYEPGLKTTEVSEIIAYLKENLILFLNKLLEEGKEPRDDFYKGNFDMNKQKELSLEALKFMNFDFSSGRLDTSVHPFTTKIGPRDVRITTKYSTEDLRYSLFSTIHECGHALYELNIPAVFFETPLDEGASMAIHESQSRFWENIIGRSLPFWNYFSTRIKLIFNSFKGLSSKDLYKGVNIVERSLLRTEADEVTYNFHIMLRFEIEEALINDKITTKELPLIWNDKMKEYLGIVPPNNSLGVLQDVHWSNGSFGYFPSYMLGNLYAAQLFSKLKQDIPSYSSDLEKGEATSIINWLKDNIHQYGKMVEPQELIYRVTGEKLNPKYFVDYITNKYTEIYNI
ncbi:MAG TPA: carboxypeptidase M32 [Defluviitoga sp.]|nr:carboxypeptidase M32 [Defluviitoga sp.]HOP24359.1 carboxypeptidase M32 [Defluviitoga sp.]HPZ28651.1 carboxypeptidase M32 [Defluviitoga sp.]HQD62558.1 carboxypeptidase M32 [Defluviitoga sp.]